MQHANEHRDAEDEEEGDSPFDRISIRFWRLNDDMAGKFNQVSFPVSMPWEACRGLWRKDEEFPDLGKILYAFERKFGPSSTAYDDYKQSFRFPFLLEIKDGETSLHLVWNLWDIKGRIDFHFRRIIERAEDASKNLSVILPFSELPLLLSPSFARYLAGSWFTDTSTTTSTSKSLRALKNLKSVSVRWKS